MVKKGGARGSQREGREDDKSFTICRYLTFLETKAPYINMGLWSTCTTYQGCTGVEDVYLSKSTSSNASGFCSITKSYKRGTS